MVGCKMTEDQAKTKWCPMVRTGLVAGMAVNHHVGGDVKDETRCIASECMMWRNFTLDEVRRDNNSKGGFCGLAGVPRS